MLPPRFAMRTTSRLLCFMPEAQMPCRDVIMLILRAFLLSRHARVRCCYVAGFATRFVAYAIYFATTPFHHYCCHAPCARAYAIAFDIYALRLMLTLLRHARRYIRRLIGLPAHGGCFSVIEIR